jgi:hypothetical protein
MDSVYRRKKRRHLAIAISFASAAVVLLVIAQRHDIIGRNIATTKGRILDSYSVSKHSESPFGGRTRDTRYCVVAFQTPKGEFKVRDKVSNVEKNEYASGILVSYNSTNPNHAWVGPFPEFRSAFLRITSALCGVIAAVYFYLFKRRLRRLPRSMDK